MQERNFGISVRLSTNQKGSLSLLGFAFSASSLFMRDEEKEETNSCFLLTHLL